MCQRQWSGTSLLLCLTARGCRPTVSPLQVLREMLTRTIACAEFDLGSRERGGKFVLNDFVARISNGANPHIPLGMVRSMVNKILKECTSGGALRDLTAEESGRFLGAVKNFCEARLAELSLRQVAHQLT
jgi:hypothetical protein